MIGASHRARVVVTGIGLWTGLGADRESVWNALRAGRSAARFLEVPGTSPGFREAGCPLHAEELELGRGERVLKIVERTAAEALDDAGLEIAGSSRVAALIGLSKGCVTNLGRVARAHAGAGTASDLEEHLWERMSWPSAGASQVAARYDLRGPCVAPVAACATGLVAVLQGIDLIRRGACDIAIAGSADASLEPMLLAAFRRMGVLATSGPDPTRAVRPWDRARSGFVVGEGGAVLILEREDRAMARGIAPYAEVAGGALGSDAFHATNMNPDPAGLAGLIRRALDRSDVAAGDVDHVNVHGTATRINDPIECRAIRLALGPGAGRVACSANKSQIGHLLGAAGAVELAIACLSIRDGFVPPTLNLDDRDPDCALDGTPHAGRALAIRAALKLSIGFGGHFAAAVLKRPGDALREARGNHA